MSFAKLIIIILIYKKECDIFDFCAGGCNSSAYMGGNITKENEIVCQVLKNVYKYVEQRLVELKNEELVNPFLVEKFKQKKEA